MLTLMLGCNECSNPNASINLPLFFNCAAPKSVLARNYNLMRTLHQNYPPYPRNIGVYTPQEPLRTANSQENNSPSTTPKKPTLDISSARKSSILKHYKSCPVSPVHEEIDWSNLPRGENKNIIFTEPKTQSMYSDDAKSILEMIHSDTEKMIEEITQKYGDLEIDEDADDDLLLDNLPMDRIMHCSKSMPRMEPKEDGNFSSDSLENCSLDLDYDENVRKKKVCKKHVKKREPKSFTYEEVRRTKYVSLSDILDDDKGQRKDYADEANYLESHRHSSASFFLTSYPMSDKKSQDSIISDYSCCNSLESILSDESDCKSAPLEFLFEKCKEKPMSKSYGSSPNSNNTFDYYMKNRKMTGYTASPLPSSNTCPQFHNINVNDFSENDIPTLKIKNKQYDSRISRSITQEFATQRQQQNSNPLIQKPPIPAKPPNLGIKKSCTFSVETKGCQLKGPRTASVVKKLESNLQKLESEKRQNMRSSKSSGALNSCLKKDQATVNRRTASMRNKDRPKISVRFNTVSQIKYTPCYKRCSPKEQSSSDENKEIDDCDGEKSFEVFIAEHAYDEVDMDLYKKPQSIDKNTKNSHNENAVKEIEKKLDIINKLIHLEEEKLDQIRIAKEDRMKPFDCNSKKGYVKSLTMNFDRLAKGIEKDIENEQMRLRIKRNVSLPDVLEMANLKDVLAVRGNASDVDEHDTEKSRNELDQKDIGGWTSLLMLFLLFEFFIIFENIKYRG